MASARPATIPDRRAYEEATDEAFRSLTLEEIMESTAQATQRAITLHSFAQIRAARPDIHCFNELLVLYPPAAGRKPARVVPDNMVVIHGGPVGRMRSLALPFEAIRPFMVLEYVSEDDRRKDYADNMRRYERDLRTPYYLLFEPDRAALALYHLPDRKTKFVAIGPNEAGRLPVPDLELEIGLVGGWARYWFRGVLLPLSEEMADQIRKAEAAARGAEAAALGEKLARESAERTARDEKSRREQAEAEVARLRAELDRLRRS